MDVNKMVAANKGLVYKALHSFNMANDPDAESYAFEALFKAATTFDASKGNTFATYAVVVINNGIRMYLRKLKQEAKLNVVSLGTIVHANECKPITLADILIGESDADTRLISDERCRDIIDTFVKCKNELHPTKRAIVDLYYSTKLGQSDIAKKLGVTQPTVSRAIAVFKHKLKTELEEYL